MFGETLLLGRVRSEAGRGRWLEIIGQEAGRLTHLVENLLHFSRSERQAHRVAPEPTWMAPLVRSVVEAFSPLAVPRRVRLRTDIAEGVVAAVDPEPFRQMLLNLLDNAVKYGPEDQTVTLTLAPADAAGGRPRHPGGHRARAPPAPSGPRRGGGWRREGGPA